MKRTTTHFKTPTRLPQYSSVIKKPSAEKVSTFGPLTFSRVGTFDTPIFYVLMRRLVAGRNTVHFYEHFRVKSSPKADGWHQVSVPHASPISSIGFHDVIRWPLFSCLLLTAEYILLPVRIKYFILRNMTLSDYDSVILWRTAARLCWHF